ncbi:MAG: hypothetical protein K2X28_06360 [Alphaproteobacteria bacterium]|nr:hypothetical protein [Alphaproteobacteria bacterium]
MHVVQKAAIKEGHYIHAKQMRRVKRELKFILVLLGIRDVKGKMEDASQELPLLFYDTLRKAKYI